MPETVGIPTAKLSDTELDLGRGHAGDTITRVSAAPRHVADDGDVTVGIQRAQSARRCPACSQAFSGDARFCPFDGDALVAAPDWSPVADPFIGRIVDGRYEVTGVLGEGGMGTVYEVRHTTLGRKFALKVLRRDITDPELSLRFIQEAKVAAAIGHPNIVAVTDFGTIDVAGAAAVPYFVMEHLTGVSLSDVLREVKALSPARAAAVVLQCANGLAAAHRAGVVHRDLKPDNVFLVRGAEREYVKLLDFGVAKMVGTGRLTKAGMVFGTPHYMSPEQAQGQSVDHRADIYALGIILYECLAGRVPFEADTYMGVLTKHMFAAPEPIEQVVRDASQLGALGPIVNRCLAKDPAERFSTMTELVAALELYVKDPARAAASQLRGAERPPDAMKLRDAEQIGSDGRLSLLEPPLQSYRRFLIGGALGGIAVALLVWRLAMPSAAASNAAATASATARAAAAAPAAASARSTPSPAVTAPRPVTPPSAAAPPPPALSAPAASTTTAPTAAAPQESTDPPSPPRSRPASARPPRSSKPAAGRGDVVDPWAH